MKKFGIPLLFGLLLITSTSCEDGISGPNRTVDGTGPIVSEDLTLPAFSMVENTGVANIYITLGSPQKVELKAQQNIIDVMTYEVVNDVLKIGLEKDVSIGNTKEIKFDIMIPEIKSVKLTGVGDYILSGDYQEELTIVITGVGNVKAYGLEVGTCIITSTGVGNCEVRVKNELNVSITGVGNVSYKGNPTISQSITGVGSLINAN